MTSCSASRTPVGSEAILAAASAVGLLGTGAQSGFRFIAALFDPQITARDLAAMVRTEVAVCARVLRVANSPFYGQRRCVTTLEQAFVILGFDAMRGIATAVCLDRSLAREPVAGVLDMQAVLRHSVATAAAAEWLARMRRPALASDAFIAGLLHNLGIVVQVHVDPQGTRAMLESLRLDAGQDIRSLESRCVAVGHEECAGVIFEAWQLPEALVAAAWHHHDPLAAPEAHRDLAALVHLGAHLALRGDNAFGLEAAVAGRNPLVMARLALTEADLDQAVAELPGRIADLRAAVFGA
jgi:HD-like signal output (HDOD) protein